MHPDWARSVRDQCRAWAPVRSVGDEPFGDGRTIHALPDGTLTDGQWNRGPGPHLKGSQPMARIGKKKAGHLLDGELWDEYPETNLTAQAHRG